MEVDWNPKTYCDAGRSLLWGHDLTEKHMEALRGGEILTLLNADGNPHSKILMDSFDQIRERLIIDQLVSPLGIGPMW